MNAFSEVQRKELIEVATTRATSEDAGDGEFAPMLSDMPGSQKMQSHVFTYNYYNAGDWAFFCSLATTTAKFNKMSKIWMERFGLRYPTGQTYRTGLSTIIVASGMTLTPSAAYELGLEFSSEFKMIRAQTEGDTTFKRFPQNPSTFAVSNPERLTEVVECRVDASSIREGATKIRIPLRTNNKRIAGKRTSTEAASSPTSEAGTAQERLLQGLLLSIVNRSPSSSPPPERRPQQTLENGETTQLALGNVAPKSSPTKKTTQLALGNVGVDGRDTMVGPGVDELLSPRPPAHVQPRLDQMDTDVASYYFAKALSAAEKKKAAALEKKKAANIENGVEGDNEDEDEAFEDAESTVAPKPKKVAKAKGKGKTKAKAKAAAKVEAPKMKRPAAIDSAVSKFPGIDRTGKTVYWGGGRVYKAKGSDMVRVYARKGDRQDKRFKYTDEASLKRSWTRACSVIVDDRRPVL